jgi:hypothetical protein
MIIFSECRNYVSVLPYSWGDFGFRRASTGWRPRTGSPSESIVVDNLLKDSKDSPSVLRKTWRCSLWRLELELVEIEATSRVPLPRPRPPPRRRRPLSLSFCDAHGVIKKPRPAKMKALLSNLVAAIS